MILIVRDVCHSFDFPECDRIFIEETAHSTQIAMVISPPLYSLHGSNVSNSDFKRSAAASSAVSSSLQNFQSARSGICEIGTVHLFTGA